MTVRNLTILAEHVDQLKSECSLPGPLEGACQLLCGTSLLDSDPWLPGGHETPDLRLTVHRLEPLPAVHVRQRNTSVSWNMNCYIDLLRKAREENLHPGICHSHPNSAASFSRQDDENECHLRSLLQYRNQNKNQFLISVLLRRDGQIEARVWYADGKPEAIPVRVLGATLPEFSSNANGLARKVDSQFLQRQALSIGQETVRRIQTLRVAIVGCGGTGSAVSVLLARAGVGHLLLLDPDVVTETNLNRLHGSTRLDVKNKRPKVSVLKDHIDQMDLGAQVVVRQQPMADATIACLLRSCDFVFGCTDDHLGRLILNRLAYFYYVPVIDTGVSVDPSKNGFEQISGRVTVLRPGVACLLCRGIINPRLAHEQGLRHKSPDEYVRQIKQGYIIDSDIPTPVIGTFTTETAAAAVNEFLAAVGGIRGNKGWASERRIRYDIDRVRSTGCEPRSDCPICFHEDMWGVGDMQPFLDLGGI